MEMLINNPFSLDCINPEQFSKCPSWNQVQEGGCWYLFINKRKHLRLINTHVNLFMAFFAIISGH